MLEKRFFITVVLGTLHLHGTIANTLAGKPDPPLGFGNATITLAPASGTLSRLVGSSIWEWQMPLAEGIGQSRDCLVLRADI